MPLCMLFSLPGSYWSCKVQIIHSTDISGAPTLCRYWRTRWAWSREGVRQGNQRLQCSSWLCAAFSVAHRKQNLQSLHRSSHVCTPAILFCVVVCSSVSPTHPSLSRGALNHFGSLVLSNKPGVWQALNLCLLNWITGNKHISGAIMSLLDVESLRPGLFFIREAEHNTFFYTVLGKL